MDIFESLLTGSQQSGVSPELLETLGKQAAKRFLEEGVALNDSITELASQHPHLQNEHVKRIVEFANNEAFQHLFQHSDDKNVHFDVADPGVVIRDLKDGGSPAHDGKVLNASNKSDGKKSQVPATDASFGGSSDYQEDPRNVQGGQGFDGLDSALASQFLQDQHSGASGQGEAIKTAFVHTSGVHANPIDDVYDEHLKLKATEEKLAEAHEQFDLALQGAQEDFYHQAKREVLGHDGAGMPGVVQAVKLAAPSDSLAFQILKPVTERLVKEGALKKGDMDKLGSARILNPAHPLVSCVSGIVKAAQEKANAAAALKEVRAGLAQTDAFLRSQAG